ncbi:MAG TPA: peptidyl-alpha-hydroxyglycine alpha-amidating lyase family protein [Gemmataceae bacterium]|nr:peptidyl-alpha-hydroxyglycine alpha-amidating lyase family protein [Gemmataceae bacterium]
MNPFGSSRDFGYAADDRWAKLPPGITWREVAAVATDSRDRVFVFNRGEHPLLVFDPDRNLLASWGEGLFIRPHGLTIGPDDSVYCTDDQAHVVHKFTPDGRLRFTLGTKGQPSDTGATSIDFRTIRQSGPPFHYPTNLALSPAGDLYVADGYGNARVHVFDPTGRLRFSWGEPGGGLGQFRIPHGIAIAPDGTVYVADRENSRVQLFTPDGRHLTEWTDVARPTQVCIDRAGDVYVSELGYRAGMWPGTTAPYPDAPGGRMSVFDPSGRLKARWGGGRDPCAAGDFFAPHDVCVDSHGNIYVAEVVWSAGGNRGLVPADCHALQKFTRRPDR